MEQLEQALLAADLKILKFDVSKQRPVSSNAGTMNVEKFCTLFLERLGAKCMKFPEVTPILYDYVRAEGVFREYAKENKILQGEKVDIEVPEHYQNLTLNMNLSSKTYSEKFFMTNPDESVSRVSGDSYLMLKQMGAVEAAAIARKVIPEYWPNRGPGVFETTRDGNIDSIFNTYTPAPWKKFDGKVPDELPELFKRLVNHLFPIEEEREYFFNWLYESMFSRAFVFLILCGAPGTGKNRLKLVMRALHGHANAVDGKKSTLVERFNAQHSESTLSWYDELQYDQEMENTMKELQNDSIAIEKKGVDATKSTRIYSSIVISNNKPRDNHIAFDARKFVPLVISSERLEESMSPEEIATLTKKVEDETSKTYDIKFIAQIANWIKKHGRSKKWPNLEYRGPMFWTLAHTSMTRWQKKAITTIIDPESKTVKWGYEFKTGKFLWSAVNNRMSRKNGDRSLQFPDFTSVRAFFEVFRDGLGRKPFTTIPIKDSIVGDFWIKMDESKMKIITEGDVMTKRGKENVKKVKRDIDEV